MTTYNKNFLETLPFSDMTIQIALAANTALSYTVPGNSSMVYRAEFSWPYNANIWVGYNQTAIVPVAGSIVHTSNASIELNPGKFGGARYVRGGDVLSFISSAIVSDAGLSLLQLPSQN